MKRVLVLDCNGLAHRAWHAMKDVKYKGQATGVIYGVLRDISFLQDHFDTNLIIFCFDEGESVRKSIYPDYKANRDRTGKEALYRQIKLLKDSILPDIGFKNILSEDGLEGDDWLAWLSKKLSKSIEVILVTRDQDMRQLLTKDKRIVCYDPQLKCVYDYDSFKQEWDGIEPHELPDVMAFMGCKTDNIKGIDGMGPATALKAFKDAGSLHERWRDKINKMILSGEFDLNLRLVKLPWAGMVDLPFAIKKDNVAFSRWSKVCDVYGLHSLVSKCPRTLTNG